LPDIFRSPRLGASRKNAILEWESLFSSWKGSALKSDLDYAKPTETAIILDFDDTLFPTTFLRQELARMGLNWRTFPDGKDVKLGMAAEIQLRRCEVQAAELIRAATNSGHVIILTLARCPWILIMCKMFYPTVGALIDSLKIPIVYARDFAKVQNPRFAASGDTEYLNMKCDAVRNTLESFYSQYEGQTWKNVISIGDSEYERLGTMQCTKAYVQRQVGKVVQVRTKTFKLQAEPNIRELSDKLRILINLLPPMIRFDGSIDADLAKMNEAELLNRLRASSIPETYTGM
jgi:hypothetical protein